MAKLNKQFIEIGLKKVNKEINSSWKEIGAMFGMTAEEARQAIKNYRYKHKEVKGLYEKGKEKFLIFSDLHIPDHNEKLIMEVVTKHKNVDYIILVGDILDCAAVSSFDSEGLSILDKELIEAHWLLRKIRKTTKAKIILVKGNHEHRVNRHYAKNAKLLGSALVETEILYKLVTGFEVAFGESGTTKVRYEPIKDVYYANARSFAYGDLLVNHPSTFSKIPMRTVTNMYEGRLKYKYPDAKVILIGHTHQAGMIIKDNGVMLIEDGCMCHNMSYAENDDKPYGAQQNAYVYLEMNNKVVDQSTVQLRHLGPATDKYNKDKLDLDNLPELYIPKEIVE